MSSSVQFEDYIVEHFDDYSYVYKSGKLVKKFEGKETSWSDAERWAIDQMFSDRLKN